jgi:molybdopterin synthase sulfur carrier subunit
LNDKDDMMNIKIILFGQLSDIAGGDSLMLQAVSDTNELQEMLKQQYPALRESKYIIAVDKRVIQENTSLYENSSIALLPPFSGG